MMDLEEARKQAMHSAAERARLRRQQEEEEREKERERARKKAAEIEAKLKVVEEAKATAVEAQVGLVSCGNSAYMLMYRVGCRYYRECRTICGTRTLA